MFASWNPISHLLLWYCPASYPHSKVLFHMIGGVRLIGYNYVTAPELKMSHLKIFVHFTGIEKKKKEILLTVFEKKKTNTNSWVIVYLTLTSVWRSLPVEASHHQMICVLHEDLQQELLCSPAQCEAPSTFRNVIQRFSFICAHNLLYCVNGWSLWEEVTRLSKPVCVSVWMGECTEWLRCTVSELNCVKGYTDSTVWVAGALSNSVGKWNTWSRYNRRHGFSSVTANH